MTPPPDGRRDLRVLRRKRDATRYQILVAIAERQPAVSQREIADDIGITAQAVSEYVGQLLEDEYVEKHGRGRYEITNEGVDWLISRTDELRAFTDYVAEEVVGQVEVEAAVATAIVADGDRVTLSMRDGVLHATPDGGGRATAVALDDAAAGQAVAVTDFDGLLDYEPGAVTVLAVPPVTADAEPDPAAVAARAETHDRVAVAGTEAFAVARAAGIEPTIQFGTPAAVAEAAARGLDVLLVVVESAVAPHVDRLREATLSYELVDLGDRPADSR